MLFITLCFHVAFVLCSGLLLYQTYVVSEEPAASLKQISTVFVRSHVPKYQNLSLILITVSANH
jgi:hypothetical protein